jgi:FOG: TPR repeat
MTKINKIKKVRFPSVALSFNFWGSIIIAQFSLPFNINIPQQPTAIPIPPIPITGDFNYYFSLCNVLRKQPRLEEALSACNQAINLSKKKRADLWGFRSDLLLKLGQYDQALVSSLQALEIQPKNSLALTLQCRSLLALGQPDQAISACDSALEINQNWEEFSPSLTWLSRGLAQEQKTQYSEALASFDQALKLDPQNSIVLVSSCRVLLEMEKNEQAIGSCDNALKVNQNWGESSPAQAWFWRGLAFSRLAKYQQVLASCEAKKTDLETNIGVKNNCILTTRISRLESAKTSYEQATTLDPEFAVAWTYQGINLGELNEYVQAKKALETAIKIYPNNALALVNLCATLNKLGNYQEALTACESGLQQDSNWLESEPADTFIQKAQALAGLKRYEEGILAIDQALSLKPDSAIAWNTKTVILWQAQKYQEALNASEKALAADPNYFQGWFNRGSILRAMQQNQEALRAYQRAIGSDITFVPIETLGSVWTNSSAILWDLGQYPEAIAAANSAIEIDPNSVSAWFNRGLFFTGVKDYEEAVKSYQQALKLDPKAVNIWVAQGMGFFYLKRYSEALNALEEALKIDPNYLPALENRDLISRYFQGKVNK